MKHKIYISFPRNFKGKCYAAAIQELFRSKATSDVFDFIKPISNEQYSKDKSAAKKYLDYHLNKDSYAIFVFPRSVNRELDYDGIVELEHSSIKEIINDKTRMFSILPKKGLNLNEMIPTTTQVWHYDVKNECKDNDVENECEDKKDMEISIAKLIMAKPASKIYYAITKERNEIFISYKRTENPDEEEPDEKYVKELLKHLGTLKKNTGIETWYDAKIKSGEKWRYVIRKHMSKARIAILMVSDDFFDSNFIYEVELPELLQAAEDEVLEVKWFHCSPSQVDSTWITLDSGKRVRISDRNAVHNYRQTLDRMKKYERRAVYTKLCTEIQEMFEKGEW